MLKKAIWAQFVLGAFFMHAAAAVAAEPAFVSPQNLPSETSVLAIQSPLNALVRAGDRLVAAGQRGHILYSDDGQHWTQAEVPVSCDLTALSFPTPREGWAAGHEGVILHTIDGGATWTRQLDGLQAAKLIGQQYGKPANPGDAAAARLQQDAEVFVAQGADKPFLDVWFEDDKRGFAVGAFNLILRTEDGGNSWTPWLDRVDNPKAFHLYAIRPVGDSVFIVGEQGLVLKLDRTRQRFERIPLAYNGTLFGLVGTRDAVLVFGLRGNAWRSTDGGANWNKVDTRVTAGLASGLALADGSIVLASQAGQLLRSTDAGASFKPLNLAKQGPIFAVAPVDAHAVALAGIGGIRLEAVQ